MIITPELLDQLISECSFRSTTSGGKGGQNVNKVATRIELYFSVKNSRVLDERSKEMILSRFPSRISADGILRVVASSERSQYRNRKAAIGKFREMMEKAFRKQPKRKATSVPKHERESRLRKKKLRSELKKLRNKSPDH